MFRRVVLRQDGNLFLEKTLLVLVSRQQLSSTLGRESREKKHKWWRNSVYSMNLRLTDLFPWLKYWNIEIVIAQTTNHRVIDVIESTRKESPCSVLLSFIAQSRGEISRFKGWSLRIIIFGYSLWLYNIIMTLQILSDNSLLKLPGRCRRRSLPCDDVRKRKKKLWLDWF